MNPTPIDLHRNIIGLTTEHEVRIPLRTLVKFAIEGIIAEFGVFEGASLRGIQAATKRTVYGFDSFKGLQEYWNDAHPVGRFACPVPDCSPAIIVEGFFQDTLDKFIDEHPIPWAFAHMDADLYSSTIYVLDRVGPRMPIGAFLVFDEFKNEPGCEHEQRAFTEYVEKSKQVWEHIADGRDNRVAVFRRIK